MSRIVALYVGLAAIMTGVARGAARVIPQPVVDSLMSPPPSPLTKREQRAFAHLRDVAAAAGRRQFLKQDLGGKRWRPYRQPHSQPQFMAISRTASGGRKYYLCFTRDQALQHKPYLVEHLNGFGQATHKERLQ